MLHRKKGVSCGPAPNGPVIYELRKKEIPVFGKLRYSFTSGMLFVPEMSGSLIPAAMVIASPVAYNHRALPTGSPLVT